STVQIEFADELEEPLLFRCVAEQPAIEDAHQGLLHLFAANGNLVGVLRFSYQDGTSQGKSQVREAPSSWTEAQRSLTVRETTIIPFKDDNVTVRSLTVTYQ